MPSVRPCRPCPSATCQPPSRIARSSRGIWRASARIRPHVSSAVAKPSDPVPHTTTPSSRAASTSIAAFWLPVVISSSSLGSLSSSSRGNGVRSRIATTISKSCSRSATASMSSRWSENVWTSVPAGRTDQSATSIATLW